MTQPKFAAATYTGLPVSSGGAHSLGRMSRRVAYQRTLAFLGECTEPVEPLKLAFRVESVPELPRDPSFERELKRRFGDYSEISQARVGDALDFLDDIDPQPTNQWGMAPVWFWATTRFRILDPATGRPLIGQDPERFLGVEYEWRVPLGTSGLRLILNTRAALGLELCIPEADADLLHRVVPWLQASLPCKLSPKHWRAWTPTKTGTFRARKMPAPE